MPRKSSQARYRRLGILAVALQLLVLALVFVVPFPRHFMAPAFVRVAAMVVGGIGALSIVFGAIGLGRALTPLPYPRKYIGLRTDGIYQFSRHPIYGGILLLAVARTVLFGSIITLLFSIVLFLLLFSKARWEESLLRHMYDGYDDYKRQTRMFF